VRSGETPKEAFHTGGDLLVSVKCHLLGVVLNAVIPSAPDILLTLRISGWNSEMLPSEPAGSEV